MGTKDGKNINMMRFKSTLANIYTVFCVVVVVLGISSLVGVMMGLRPFVMISESMHPEVPKNSLVLLDTSASVEQVEVGDNVAYVLGKVEAMHKTASVGSDEIVVKSLADQGETLVSADMYVGKEVLSIPAVGGWIRSVLYYKWAVIGIAGALIVVGCIPRKKGQNGQKEEDLKTAVGA